MPRSKRPYLPGAVFHLTARTQNHHDWFVAPVRNAATRYIVDAIELSDADLLAYAVMPNHLHLVLRQGSEALGRVMLRLLRRVALCVQRVHDVEGHVFERRYRSHPCLDAEYIRNAIVYTNLNPLRAGLVDDPLEYRWTTHCWYSRGDADFPGAGTRHRGDRLTLPLFAHRAEGDISDLRRAYEQFVEWRIAWDRYREAVEHGRAGPAPEVPPTAAGDAYWRRTFRTAPELYANPAAAPRSRTPRRTDLRDLARSLLCEASSSIDLHQIRRGNRSHSAARIRHALIERLRAAGHRPVDIARFVGTSPTMVTKVVTAWQRRGTFLPLDGAAQRSTVQSTSSAGTTTGSAPS